MYDLSTGLERVPVSLTDDRYIDGLQAIRYCKTNIPGPGSTLEDFEDTFEGCDCIDRCTAIPPVCSCLAQFGPTYDARGRLLDESQATTNSKPVFECHKNCKCVPDLCCNRVVQKGIQYPLTVFKTDHKGYAVMSAAPIQKHTFVCEYAGEVLSCEEAKKRSNTLTEDDMNYIIVSKEHMANGTVFRTHVDPTNIGNVGRYLNHSCDPNLLMAPVRTGHTIPRLALFASRDIEACEELCYSYSGVPGSESDTDLAPKTEIGLKQCFCRANICTGYLPFCRDLFTTPFTTGVP